MAHHTLRERLLRDIAEIRNKPYPNIALKIDDHDISIACLVLTVKGYSHMHMTVTFPDDYPLSPPKIQMNSTIKHPNIYGSYICSSILNTEEGYTSAYTLKGIAIQMLSFFSSDRVEQTGGGYSVDLSTYKARQVADTYQCHKCGCGRPNFNPRSFNTDEPSNTCPVPSSTTSGSGNSESFNAGERASSDPAHDHAAGSPARHTSGPSSASTPAGQGSVGRNARRRRAREAAEARARAAAQAPPTPDITASSGSSVVAIDLAEPATPRNIVDMKLPNEVVLAICNRLDTEDLMVFAQAWSRIPRVMRSFDVIRTRELQCFCLKEDYLTVKLGVGIHVDPRTKSIESEFDLLSQEGFGIHLIRRSTQGRPFEHWLPLPISNGHWRKVAADVPESLTRLATSANIQSPTPAKVIFHFMNDIVVKLNQKASQPRPPLPNYYYSIGLGSETIASSLTHASEKAIESYFHLFHLLVCLATANPAIVRSANAMINNFIAGQSSKADCPNLGHLLVAALISDVDITEVVIKAIIKETVTRNVVWMLTSNPELAYLEPSAASEYRLHHTFQASKTSYRLLMFLNLFRKTAVGTPRKPLIQLRDEAFERHGAPPRGSAAGLAAGIKRIHAVNRFPDFLAAMDIQTMPSKQQFNAYLHKCIQESAEKQYSRMPITQGEALTLRQAKEPNVEVAEGMFASYMDMYIMGGGSQGGRGSRSFFPQRGGSQARGRGRGRGGRGGRG